MELAFQQLFQTMPCYVTVQDRDYRIIEANRRFQMDFGDYEGRYCYQVYKQRSERCRGCPVALTFRDGESHHGEQRIRNENGKDLSVMVYTSPIKDDNGEIVAVMEMATDITETALVREQLHDSQERYHAIFDEVPCYISIQDRDMRIVEANRRYREDFGTRLGSKCFETYKHRDKECLICPVQRTFEDGQVHHSEEVVTSSKGERINVLVYTAPLRDRNGEIKHVMEMSTNITEIRQLESKLTQLGLLVGTISHGIKGLLTGLDGGRYFMNTGLKKDDPKRVEKGWDMVQRNVDQIRSMVLNILFYAKDREPDWEEVSAAEIVGEVVEVVSKKAGDTGIKLEHKVAGDAGRFDADPQAVRSMLINLLENSIDACISDETKDSHRVAIRAAGGDAHVEFEIEDNGIGMDQETREKAFSMFFSSKGTKGTGLGLFIANKIALAHGGAIRLESEVDRGTRFIVKLSRKRPADIPRAAAPTEHASGASTTFDPTPEA